MTLYHILSVAEEIGKKYIPSNLLTLSCDVSSYDIGVFIVSSDGTEIKRRFLPSLSLDKKSFAIMFGVKNFPLYL